MIEQVRVKNFRRYRDASVKLGGGVNFVDGENNVGKTSLFYAIEYGLFGKVEGFKSQVGLMRPGARAMGVEIVFVGRDGQRYLLQRVHAYPPRAKKNLEGHFTLKRISEDGQHTYLLASDFQDREEHLTLKLQELTGLTRRLFGVAVNMRQGEIARILEGAAQLDIVLGVTAAVVAEEELRAVALELEKEAATLPVLQESVRRLDEERQGLMGRIGSLEAEEATASQQVTALNQERAAVSARRALLEPLVRALSSLDSSLSAQQQQQGRLVAEQERLVELEQQTGGSAAVQAQLSTLEAGIAARAVHIKAENTTLAAKEAERRQQDTTRGDLSGRIRRRKALPTGGDATCEACGAPIDAAHNAREVARWEEELATIEAATRGIEAEITTIRQQISALQQQDREDGLYVSRLKGQADQLQSQQASVEKRAAQLVEAEAATRTAAERCRGAVESVLPSFPEAPLQTLPDAPDALRSAVAGAIDRLRQDLVAADARLEAEVRAASARLSRAEQELRQLRARQADVERELASIQAKIRELEVKKARAERLRRLSAGFKGLQVQIREQASAALAQDTHLLHQKLSGQEDEFTALSIDPVRYSVQVVPRDVGEEVPAALYEGGGHRLLLGLAFRLAVVRLVGHCPFVLLDEPTYGLDRHRLTALLERITGLGVVGQMLLITHQPMGDAVGRRIRVRREGKESVIEEVA